MECILAIDQSYTATGIALINDGRPMAWEVIKPKTKFSRAAKREFIVKRINELLAVVDLIVIERLWEAPGISLSTSIIDVAHRQNKQIRALSPRSWKKAMLGHGNAAKAISIQIAQLSAGAIILDDNIADAINIGVCATKHPELLKQPE
jgi:Holliday junction resolvasome RuvABC endonuclease subunit